MSAKTSLAWFTESKASENYIANANMRNGRQGWLEPMCKRDEDRNGERVGSEPMSGAGTSFQILLGGGEQMPSPSKIEFLNVFFI